MEPATAEGGDFVRLDERTLLAGRGFRTSEDGIRQVGDLLPDVEPSPSTSRTGTARAR